MRECVISLRINYSAVPCHDNIVKAFKTPKRIHVGTDLLNADY